MKKRDQIRHFLWAKLRYLAADKLVEKRLSVQLMNRLAKELWDPLRRQLWDDVMVNIGIELIQNAMDYDEET